jgi:glucose-6-phosphate isomerase
MSATDSPAWKKLTQLAARSIHTPLSDWLTANERFDQFSFQVADVLLDASKQRINAEILDQLLELAQERDVRARITDLVNGAEVNSTEKRPALHTALRAPPDLRPASVSAAIEETLQRVVKFADAVRSGHWLGHSGKALTTVVHIGIGGSHLGPELAVQALQATEARHLDIHFVANIDQVELRQMLVCLDPERTLFIVASKSFTTLETRLNSDCVRSWFLERVGQHEAIERHFVAVTGNPDAAAEFGIHPDNFYPMWDWVGGRYSLWSAVGLPVALAIGGQGFRELLAGAAAVDDHFTSVPNAENVPLLMALIGIWNYNFLGVANHAILPYSAGMKRLPDHLQQLEMESNGKHVNHAGEDVGVHTAPIIWGGQGTNGQHAFHQLLHQGTRSFTADFILNADADASTTEHARWLLANGIAQSQAMMTGHSDANPHLQVAGEHATTTIVLRRLNPFTLGSLLAIYEHKVFCQGVIWDINSFDQYGVELGKRLAGPIFDQLGGKSALGQDASTTGLIESIRKAQRQPLATGGSHD